MLEQGMLFLLGGSGYLAIELAWRGTSHWTMFLAGGVCLCLLQQLARQPISLSAAAEQARWGSAAWRWLSALFAVKFCM